MTAIADPPAAVIADLRRPRPRPGREIFRTAVSVALVAAIFGFALPHFASYRSVWASMQAMTWTQALLVAAAAAASMASTWIMICSVLPSIRLREAAVVNLGSNAVANTLPAGGALAMGVSLRPVVAALRRTVTTVRSESNAFCPWSRRRRPALWSTLPLRWRIPLLRSLAPVLAAYDGAAELERGLDILLTGLATTLPPPGGARSPSQAG